MKRRSLSVLAALALVLGGCSGGSNYSWDKDLQHRLACDFNWTYDQVKEYVARYIPDVTDEQMEAWTASGVLESMEIDGTRMYFNRTAPNLFRVDAACKAVKDAAEGNGPAGTFFNATGTCASNLMEALWDEHPDGSPLGAPKRMKVHYTLTVDADAVPAGEVVRCWLPFPRKDVARQQDVRFIDANVANVTFSDPECVHSTVYMEKVAVAGEPVVFEEEFEYTSYAEIHRIDADCVAKAAAASLGVDASQLTGTRSYYNTDSDLYREFTAEREAHIVFSPRLRELAARLAGDLTNPYDVARAYFTWINDNFPWAGAREYSTIPAIPEYVLDNGHGDCGQVTLLFVTLCRIAGIPGHFQSGFAMHPGDDGMHDWGEIYFEGLGWVPVDQSFGIMDAMVRTVPLTTEGNAVRPAVYTPNYPFESVDQKNLNDWLLFAYLGSIDSYRMVVNSDYGRELSPAKTFPRSETVDFQRGEVEWKGGNIYFDQWDYHMDIKYLN